MKSFPPLPAMSLWLDWSHFIFQYSHPYIVLDWIGGVSLFVKSPTRICSLGWDCRHSILIKCNLSPLKWKVFICRVFLVLFTIAATRRLLSMETTRTYLSTLVMSWFRLEPPVSASSVSWCLDFDWNRLYLSLPFGGVSISTETTRMYFSTCWCFYVHGNLNVFFQLRRIFIFMRTTPLHSLWKTGFDYELIWTINTLFKLFCTVFSSNSQITCLEYEIM